LVGFSAVVLTIGGIFALIEGLTAVYKSSFFTANAVFVFSDLRTWGWIIFGLGVAGVISGLSVLSGREWARWLGVTVAGLSALSQLLFAQAYPLWSLMIMAVDFLVIYGLIAYAGRQSAAGASSSYDSYESTGSGTVADMNDRERKSRAA
jgi:dihydrodipicolinate synthase/N-acetylneuraminate lyase